MVGESQSPQLHVDVAPGSQRVQRGEEVVFLVTIENRGREAQAQSIQVTGLPDAWIQLEFDSRHRAFPGERRTASLLVRVPAEAEPGRISFGISVRSGTDQSTAGCALEVMAGGAAAAAPAATTTPAATVPPPGVSLSPQRVTWRGEAQGAESVTVTVRNVGPEDADYIIALAGLASHWYTLEDRLSVPSRQAVSTQLVLTPPGQARQGSYDFSISATLAGNEAVRAEATCNLTIAGQAEMQAPQRPVSPLPVEEVPADRGGAPPAMPPEVSLGPRTTFRFGPGEVTAQANISIANRSRLIERYLIMVRGIDEDWYQLSQSEVSLQPGGDIQVPLRLTPRTGAQFPAGEYSFRVRVAPASFTDSFAEAAGTISIAGVISFDARVTPNRATGRKEKFKLTLLNTGGLPISPWLEASDPQGLCKFKYEAPSNLEVGEEAVVPIWVGATRQGFAGHPRTLDFRLRVSPAGGGSSAARSFDGTFIHQPFFGPRMLFWCLLAALIAIIIGMLIVIGFSSVESAVTTVRCGFDDDYQEPDRQDPEKQVVLIREDCGGAPTALQRGFFPPVGGESPTATTVAGETQTVTPTATPEGTATLVPDACVGDPDIGLEVGDEVTLRVDARIRDAPAGEDTGRRGENKEGIVTDGPECADELVWWEVETEEGSGWTAEQDENKVRLILER